MIMTEGSLDIVFDESYCAVKFDDSLFYRKKFETKMVKMSCPCRGYVYAEEEILSC